jgi:hypothetical protein
MHKPGKEGKGGGMGGGQHLTPEQKAERRAAKAAKAGRVTA